MSVRTGDVWRGALALCAVLVGSVSARAQSVSFAVADGAGWRAATSVRLAVDADDDDDDGTVDALQPTNVPADELRTIEVRGAGPVELTVEGGVRLLRARAPVAMPLRLGAADLPARLELQATRATAGEVVARSGGATASLHVTVVGVAFLDAGNRPIDPSLGAVGLSHEVTNDTSLPREDSFTGTSTDPDNVRIEVFDPSVSGNELAVAIEARDVATGLRRDERPIVRLARRSGGGPFRSGFLRLVGDAMDQQAPGVGDRVLRVALRDAVRIRYVTPDGAVTHDVRVGRPGDEDGPTAARRVTPRIRVLRVQPGGAPSVGANDATALAIARHQVEIADEIWLQCFVTFGAPDTADVAVVDPPPPTLLAIADRDGLPAAGGGTIRFRVDGRPIRAVSTRAGATPVQTALAVAEAVRAAGLRARVTENAPTEFGAGRSADVLVQSASGALVRIEPDQATPVGTDARQSATIGSVDLGDGIGEFDNMTATSGTIEERTLIKALADDDPTTIDLFIVNRFTSGTRQGEAFIEGDGGAIVNTLILDRAGIRQEREAWTQAHEAGHILLDQPFHPDNVGRDRPWLLMDADNSAGLVTGPKRLGWDECARVTQMSGVDAVPALLSRWDVRAPRPTPRPNSQPYDQGYAR